MKPSFIGHWRIVEMEQWDQEFVDMVSPGRITFSRGKRGELHFGAVDATLDWRVDDAQSRVEFSFHGFDEGDEVSGRGWARIDGSIMKGWFAFHMGDESEFTARKPALARSSSESNET